MAVREVRIAKAEGPNIDPETGLDVTKKYLSQIDLKTMKDTGFIYPWTPQRAKRKDMREYSHNARRGIHPQASLEGSGVPDQIIELQGREFKVDVNLHSVLTDMVEYMKKLELEVATLKAKPINPVSSGDSSKAKPSAIKLAPEPEPQNDENSAPKKTRAKKDDE